MKPPKPVVIRLLLGLSVLLALALRVALPYRAVFGQDFVAFTESDAWYHMRLVDGLIQTFPWRIWHDAYLIHPGGEAVNAGPMFDWLIAGMALLLGGGSPSPRLVDLVGAFTPAVLGCLTVLPIYGITRSVFSERAGLWAALCAAVIPGDFMVRSSLGFTDHHCAEVFFTTLTLYCVLEAISEHRTIKERRLGALRAGLALAAYALTWGGASLFLGTLVLWATVDVLIAYARNVNPDRIVEVTVLAFAVTALCVLPWTTVRPSFSYTLIALVGGAGGLGALHVVARLAKNKGIAAPKFLALVVLFVLVAGATSLFVVRHQLGGLLGEIGRLSPFRTNAFVSEAVPLLRSSDWAPFPLWNQFGAAVLLCWMGLLAGLFVTMLRDSTGRLVLAWGAVSFAATLGQVRFTYYLAVPVVIVAGEACCVVIDAIRRFRVPALVTSCVLVALVCVPGVPTFRRLAAAPSSISPDWFDALMWLRSSTPEPFAEEQSYATGGGGETSSYGVMNWWDYGYWISRVGHRVPVSNPKQSGLQAALDFYLSEDAGAAAAAMARAGARYVMVDAMMQISTGTRLEEPGFFSGMLVAGGRSRRKYCEGLLPPGDSRTPALYCYPDYYKTAAIQLYAFGGKPVEPDIVWVIDVEASKGGLPGRVRNEWSFPSYGEAVKFSELRPAGQLRIASKNPRQTCVPLPGLPEFVPAYQSLGSQPGSSGRRGPSVVQVYQYRPRNSE